MFGIPLFILASPSILDSVVRLILAAGAARPVPAEGDPVDDWVVLVPAREEGENLRATLNSIPRAIRTIVVLDGPDDIGASIARERGVEVMVKEPAGPTKGAVMAWAAQHAPLDAAAVLLLDVGSRLSEDFFQRFRWKQGSSAMQAFIAGSGGAAAVSESFAQGVEDAGREGLGWSVRLRGTGTAFRPEIFRAIAPRLSTQVEDLETSLLLAAAGHRLTMADPAALVLDEKPEDVFDSATQRSRWLAGRFQVAARHPAALGELIRRNPLEGIAFACELASRPLSLSAMLRAAAGGVLLWEKRYALAAIALASVAADVAVHARRGAGAGDSARLFGAWVRAAAQTPRALGRWMRARRS